MVKQENMQKLLVQRFIITHLSKAVHLPVALVEELHYVIFNISAPTLETHKFIIANLPITAHIM